MTELDRAIIDFEALRDKFRTYGENHLKFVNGLPLSYHQGSGEAFVACARDLDNAINAIKRDLQKEARRARHEPASTAHV